MNDQESPHITLRKPGERPLLEIWHIGYGPNISYGICVAEPPRTWGSDQEFEPSQQPLVGCYSPTGLTPQHNHPNKRAATWMSFLRLASS